MDQFITNTIVGLCVAGTFGIAAGGLVLTYSTTGIFNFAHGAIAMLGAFTYWQLRAPEAWGLPAPLALLITLVIAAPAFGAILEIAIMRRLQGATEAAKVVVSISLLVGFLQMGRLIWPEDQPHPFRPFFSGNSVQVLGTTVTWHDLSALVLGILVALGLRVLLFGSRPGIAMRAAVDDRELAGLHGARPDTSARLAWAIGCSLAALSGILLAGMQGLTHVAITLLIVNAFAAAVLGRLRSLPITFVGAVLLGLADSYATSYLPSANLHLTGLRPAMPIILLFIALLALPSSPLRGHTARTAVETISRPVWGRTLLGCAFFLLFALQLVRWLSQSEAQTLAQMFGLALIAASLVPLIGWAGQLSLCALSFAGIGAIVMAHHGAGGHWKGLLYAAVICAVIGAIVALPALRLSGLYLALATAAFAVVLDRWIFLMPDFHLGSTRIRIFGKSSLVVDPLHLPGIDTSAPKTLFMLLAVVFCGFVLLLTALRRSSYGERLLALKDSQAAAATLGMDTRRTKLGVFALSAAMAGLGGAFYGAAVGAASADRFTFFAGLPIALLIVVGGVGSAWGALSTGILMSLVPFIFAPIKALTKPLTLLPATLGVALGRSPDGIVGEISTGFAPLRADQRRERMVLAVIAGLGIVNLIGLLPFRFAAPAAIIVYIVGNRLAVAAARQEVAATAVDLDADIPAERIGIDRPITLSDLAEADRVLGIEAVRR